MVTPPTSPLDYGLLAPHLSLPARGVAVDHETIVQLIGSVRTSNGLFVKAKLDTRSYETGIAVPTAPYMHDGSLATLEEVIDQYDRGGQGDPTTNPQIKPLGLSAPEKIDLLAFLRSLTDPSFLSDPRYQP